MRGQGSVWAAALATGGLVAASAALAQGADEPLRACAAITKRSARLACYDDAAHGQATRGPAPVRSGAPIAQGLGAEQVRDRRPLSERPVEVSRTLARVASVADNGTGHLRFALSDGSTWEMPQADPYFVPPRRGEVVRIRKGAIGSYLLDAGRQASVKVTRVR